MAMHWHVTLTINYQTVDGRQAFMLALAFYLEGGGGGTLSGSALAFFSWGVGGGGGVLKLMKRGVSAEAI